MVQKRKSSQDDLKKRIREAEERYKRALADYQNLQKRTEKEKQEFLKFATSTLIAKLLTILDGLEAAQKHLKDESLNLLIKEFKQILKQEGVVEMNSLGEKFDPEIHECVELVRVRDEKLVNQVIEEVRKGYQMKTGENCQILRYPQVKVGQKVKD